MRIVTKESWSALLLSSKIDVKTKLSLQTTFDNDKRSIYQEDMTIISIYTPNNIITKYMKQKPDRIEGRKKSPHQ